MNRGLIIGKFMPVHLGHLALIEFASHQCDELIVSLSYTPHDVIPSDLRITWLKELLKDRPTIKVGVIVDDFDQKQLPLHERTKIWAQVLKKHYPTIHNIFSSESYGEHLAQHLDARSILFDPSRSKFPISASKIRSNPALYWDYIPTLAQHYFVKKICFYGPESTGKSTMAKRMAEVYQTEFVPEVARELITSNDFTIEDIVKIGHAQTNRVKEKLKTANRFLFCDTDLITTQIYSRHYLGVVPPILYQLEKEIQFDHYFLFDVDVEWVSDGLRDLNNRREEMMKVFKSELSLRNIVPTWVKGTWVEREQIIRSTLNK